MNLSVALLKSMYKQSFLKILILGCFLLLLSSFLKAQGIKATAKLDSSNMMVGDQVKLELQLSRPANQKIKFPIIGDTIQKIEVLNKSKIDTVPSEDKSIIIERQTFELTCFDSGHYAFPPFKFTQEGDTNVIAETEAMLLSVYAPKVDTTQAIKEIKGPLDLPFSWKEAAPYIAGGFLIVAIISAICFYLISRKKKPEVVEVKLPPARPAHVIALEALRSLEKEKVWQTPTNGMKI